MRETEGGIIPSEDCIGGSRGMRAGTATAGGGGDGRSTESRYVSSPYCFLTPLKSAATLLVHTLV